MRRFFIAVLAVAVGAAIGVFAMLERQLPVSGTAQAQTDDPQKVALNVLRDGRALRLNWNRDARPVREADRAVLYINDGKHQSRMELDPQHLRSGTAAYYPESPEVHFKLEVFSGDRSTYGMIDTPGVMVATKVLAAKAPAEKKPSPFQEPPAKPKRRPPPPVVASVRPLPQHRAVAERRSGFSRVVGKIPLFRRLKKSRQPAD